ncbi:MAG: LuxR C-terminal-related transcriptional regulator [Hyphomicrobiales bacterium]
MKGLRISGPPSLLVSFVQARVSMLYPREEVRIDESQADLNLPGVIIEVEGTGRWLYVAPARGVEDSAVAALSAGARAVLHLDSTDDEFARALKATIAGERGFVPVDIVQWMASQALGRDDRSRAALKVELTRRERQILQLVARGYSNSEIAEALTISTNTVRSHLHALSVKLDASSRTRMLANARALSIPEALDFERHPADPGRRVPA